MPVKFLINALLFQFGGFTTLGVNSLNMALPAIICYFIFSPAVRSDNFRLSAAASFMVGFGAVFLSSIMVALSLFLSGDHFLNVARIVVIANLPVMFIEGLITLFCVRFLKKVKPEILEVVYEK